MAALSTASASAVVAVDYIKEHNNALSCANNDDHDDNSTLPPLHDSEMTCNTLTNKQCTV